MGSERTINVEVGEEEVVCEEEAGKLDEKGINRGENGRN